MNYISIQDIIACNQKIADRKLPYKVHLRDACGRQTGWFEKIAADGSSRELTEEEKKQCQNLLQTYFAEQGVSLEFESSTGVNFWIGKQG